MINGSTTRAEHEQKWLIQLQTALQSQGQEAAGKLALRALGDGVDHLGVINLAASAHFDEGRFDDALALLERARVAAPNDPRTMNSIGLCLRALGRLEDALEVFDSAIEIAPTMASAQFNRGIVLEDLKYTKAARLAYERAAAIDPDQIDAIASIAWLDAQAGDAVSAQKNGERVMARSPSHVMARLALASADLQLGDLDTAAVRLSALDREPKLEQEDRAVMLGLLGDLYDAQDRPTEAFAAYQASNATQKAMYGTLYDVPGRPTAIDHVAHLNAWFAAADPEAWRNAPAGAQGADDPKKHVFLVGFPRSGTTLLENILAAHPDVVSLEERNCLESAATAYLASTEGLERLARIGVSEAERERESYWLNVRKFGAEPSGKVFIDKLPLASVALPLIAKLFPNALILFARRDPRDVVLSCFRRRFAMNASMYQLLTLESAATYYASVMQVSALYQELLPLRQHLVRYESLVDDFEGTARETCDFLGLDWNEDLFEFATKARSREIVTPSAAQVVRGINREGQGVWRRYREQMAPVMSVLERWVSRFGYAA